MASLFFVVPEVANAAATGDGSIRSTVKIVSGTANGPTLIDSDTYGTGVAVIGDLDLDGVPDLAVSAFQDDTGGINRGALYIHFMNSNGSIKSTTKIAHGTPNGPTLTDNDFYGVSVGALGDLDLDGVPDLAVGVQSDDTGGTDRGAVYIHFMNSNGSIKSTTKIASGTLNGATLTDGDRYGIRLAVIGDLDLDGARDLAIGADSDDTGGINRGAVYIHFMNSNGSIKSTTKIAHGTPNGPTLANSDAYGFGVGAIGDLDLDGVRDLAVGALGDDTGGSGRGALYIHFMNSNGSIKSTTKIAHGTPNGPTLADSDSYGTSSTGIGDLDLDGVRDLAVGARGDNSFRGALYIHFMNSNGSIKSTTKIASGTLNGPTLASIDFYGNSVAALDLDRDGVSDIVVGATRDDTGGTDRGTLYIHFMTAFPVPSGSGGCDFLIRPNGGEHLTAGQSYEITWSHSVCPTEKVRLSLSTDGGANYPTLIADNEPEDGSYDWTVPNTPTTSAKVKVELLGPGGTVQSFDSSDADFTIFSSNTFATPPTTTLPPPTTPPSTTPTYDPAAELAAATSIDVDQGWAVTTEPKPCIGGTAFKGASTTSVFYCGSDGKKHVFPNEKTYKTWYADFTHVITLLDATVASIPEGKHVTYKPGVRMVKLTTDNKVYAVSKGGVLRWIETEAVAVQLYGADWNMKIDDLSASIFEDYTIGENL